jgi:hypothetical protein
MPDYLWLPVDERKYPYVWSVSRDKKQTKIHYPDDGVLFVVNEGIDELKSTLLRWPEKDPNKDPKEEWPAFHQDIADRIEARLSRVLQDYRWVVTINDGDEDGIYAGGPRGGKGELYPGQPELRGLDKVNLRGAVDEGSKRWPNKRTDVIACGLEMNGDKISEKEREERVELFCDWLMKGGGRPRGLDKCYYSVATKKNFPIWKISSALCDQSKQPTNTRTDPKETYNIKEYHGNNGQPTVVIGSGAHGYDGVLVLPPAG